MKFLFILFAAFMFGTSCGTTDVSSQEVIAKNIPVHEFWEKVTSLENAQILDVRTPEECAEGIIPKAAMANWHDEDFLNQIDDLDPDLPVLIYCRSGGRSGQAMAKLKEIGFKEIFNLEGGFMAWEAANLEVSK